MKNYKFFPTHTIDQQHTNNIIKCFTTHKQIPEKKKPHTIDQQHKQYHKMFHKVHTR